MDARSVMEVQQRSLTSKSPSLKDAVLRGGLGLERNVADGRQSRAPAFHERKQPGQLGVVELDSLRPAERPKRVDGELLHAGFVAHNLVLAHTPSESPAVA